jgi:hypothetical protein
MQEKTALSFPAPSKKLSLISTNEIARNDHQVSICVGLYNLASLKSGNRGYRLREVFSGVPAQPEKHVAGGWRNQQDDQLASDDPLRQVATFKNLPPRQEGGSFTPRQ